MELPQNNIHTVGTTSDINTINFSIRVEEICEKIKRCIDKGQTNKIIGYMFDIKSEVERYTGSKIDIGKQIDQVQKEARSRGKKIDEKQLKKIKKDFERIDKKYTHRAVWMAKCMETDIPYTSIEADWNFEYMFLERNSKEQDQGKNDDVYVPVTVTVGVTLSLCGLFLLFVPVPICKTSGWYLLDAGIGVLSSDVISKWDEYDREKHGKNNSKK